jgi:hypothetical protein
MACGLSDIDLLLWAIPHLWFLLFFASLFLYRQVLTGSPAVSKVQVSLYLSGLSHFP